MESFRDVHSFKPRPFLAEPVVFVLTLFAFTVVTADFTDLFDHSTNRVLPSHDDQLIGGISPEKCAELCLKGTTTVPEGECLSFDYRKVSGGRCQLSRDNKDTAGQTLAYNSDFDHYEMKDIVSFFTVQTDRVLPGHDDVRISPPTVSPRTCALRCLLGEGSLSVGSCLSFDLDSRPVRCLLSGDNENTAGDTLDTNTRFDYYQRNDFCAPDLCVHGTCSSETSGYTCTCDVGWGGDTCDTAIITPQSCADLSAIGIQGSNSYHVGHPEPFQVSCDMDTDGGGWTVIQRRQDGTVTFNKPWADYVQGFGDADGELWLGLEHLRSLTTQAHELYIYLEDWGGNTVLARYGTFSVGDESSDYRLTLSGHSSESTVDDDLTTTSENGRHSINNRGFATTDHGGFSSCAVDYGQGGWWYPASCGLALLNGQYFDITCSTTTPPSCSHADGIVWSSWKTYRYSLKKTIMMIRPGSFPSSSPNACQNGGTLTLGTPGSGVYTCACPAGFGGTYCEQACTPGEFGPGCTGTCHCTSGGSVCDVMTGVCSSGGCEAGWGGNDCQTVCTGGTFGPDCASTCHCASGGSVCDVTTGICSAGGCAAGWKGSDCQTVCVAGEFGPGCTGTCHCASGGSVCDVQTGVCSDGGCAAGWKETDCQTPCSPGEFGPDCTGTCHCLTGDSACNNQTGACTGGCAAGWKGDDCQTVCESGEFGPGCTSTCHCLTGDSACNTQTGACTGGCAAGFKGDDCQTACSHGEFGPNCTHTCHCADGDSVCPAGTGVCTTGGCAAGWEGVSTACQTACSGGTFGPDCSGTCHCENGDSACNSQTGACTGGCAAGWKGDDCQTVCHSGEFGPGCANTCHCAGGDSVCNIQTGVCSSGGCEAGWEGSNCQTACMPGEFGPGCTGTCHCASGGSVCDVMTGVCSSGGCSPGWSGDSCQTGCADGTFGAGCTGVCHCLNGDSVCSIETGECSSGGCAAGWKGNDCQTVCVSGEFGPGCTLICHCASGGSVCDVMTGVCSDGGCAVGWEGNSCQMACDGSYGPDCSTMCGNCYLSQVCNRFDGTCPIGQDHVCAAGYLGEKCDQGCNAGTYGLDCQERCGLCKTDSTCNAETGVCQSGCQPPWDLDLCKEILCEVTEHPQDLSLPLSHPATFTCVSLGEPLPTVTWYHGDELVSGGDDITINTTQDSLTHTVRSTLTISAVKRRDNGQYQCRSINGTNSDMSHQATLAVLERPEDVTVTLTSPSSKTMQVAWTVGFAGNLDINASEVTHKRSDETSWGPWVTTASAGTEGTHELTGLSSATNYTVKVRVRNFQGWSDPAEAKGRTGNAPSNSSLGAAIGGTVGALVVVGVIAAAGIFIYRRRLPGKEDVPLHRPVPKRQNYDEDGETPLGAIGPAASPVVKPKVPVRPKHQRQSRAGSRKATRAPGVPIDFRQPIPIDRLESEFARRHANDDQLFNEEYAALPKTLGREHAEAYYDEEHAPKNKFRNIIAYDNGIVRLTPIDGVPGSTYINASYMDGYKEPEKFIASQAPMDNTLADFWRMIWETGSTAIVMVTNLEENGKKKCSKYWPDSGEKIYNPGGGYGALTVKVEEVVPMVDHVTRVFLLSKAKERRVRKVTHFHFIGWPDFGLPKSPTGLLKFRKTVMSSLTSNDRPIVVHCSAGVGRTGTFITVDAMLDMIKEEGNVDVFRFVEKMRQNRSFMVQTEAQYVFIFKALLEDYLYGDTETEVASIHRYMGKLKMENPETHKTGFETEFEKLTRIAVDKANMRSGNLPENLSKNRVLQVLPYDTTRVFLQQKPGVKGADYINASFIDGYNMKDAYIATQGPLDRTVEDFWRMVWEWNSCSIVMITEIKEKGQSKCAMYWPEEGSQAFGDYTVSLQDQTDYQDYTLRTLHLTKGQGGQTRTVQQFHFHGWPEVGIPDNAAGMIDLIGQVQKQQQHSGNGPITVHCSAGAGRTGAFCAISTVLERVKAEGVCDVFQVVKTLRLQRPHMVQTLDQYQFCYQAVVEYLDSFDHYANFR